VIERTTFVQTKEQYLATLGNNHMPAEEIELVSRIPTASFPNCPVRATEYETWAGLGLHGPEEDCFSEFYGMPASILRLIAKTNNIVAQIESPEHHGTTPMSIPAHMANTAAAVETEICQWTTSEKYSQASGDTLTTMISSDVSTISPTQAIKSNIATAMHHALLVYFFRFVRGTNPIILQHYVESILENLELHHESKQCFFPGMRLGVIVWPSFIAACEALGDNLRQRAILCMRHAAWAGFQNAETAEMVAREVWRRRDAGELHVSWSTVLRESQTILLLT
jgi:arginine metabolism regulation protein II